MLGYVFWMACARGVSASTIGMTSTVISAMTLVAILAAAGFEPFLTRVLPGATPEERSGLCSTALVAHRRRIRRRRRGGALLLPERVHAAVGTGWLVGLLGAGAVGTALLLVINAALLGVRRAELSLVGSVVGSLSRLVTVVALLTSGSGRHRCRRHGRSHDSRGVGGLAVGLLRPVRTVARPCDARFPLPLRPDLAVPAATRSGVGSRRHARCQVARLHDADSRLRALPARPSRIRVHGVDDQHGFLRGVRLSLQLHCWRTARTVPNASEHRRAALCG